MAAAEVVKHELTLVDPMMVGDRRTILLRVEPRKSHFSCQTGRGFYSLDSDLDK